MHTRRLASFLVGAWLLGSAFMLFLTLQQDTLIGRIMGNPPRQLVKEIEDLGPELTRQTLQYHSAELIRFMRGSWNLLQAGLGLALLACCVLTSHRSKFLIIVTSIMFLLTLIIAGYLSPRLTAVGRVFDFSAQAAFLNERANYQSFSLLHGITETLKVLCGLALAGRLLFDRASWNRRETSRRELRRRSRSSQSRSLTPQVNPVDHSDHGHVNG